ncbi:MAG: DsbC family protein [Methylococcales bacterium]
MNHFKTIISTCLGSTLLLAASVYAGEAEVRQAIKKIMPSQKIDSIKPSDTKGLYEVIAGPNILYVSDNGKYLLQGHLIDLEAKKDLTEGKMADGRSLAIKEMGEDNMIIFKPEKSKYKVSVFTDLDCGYCRKLHSEIDKYMAEGITIQYMFYPRAGKGSSSYKKAISVWCSNDRKQALTDAKKGKTITDKTCDNPIDKHMALATKFGVQGTPMIVTESGTILPGYVPADRLAKVLASE